MTSENVDKPLIIKTTELITNNLQDNDESTNTTIGFGGITTATPIPKTHLTYDDTDKEQNTLATMLNNYIIPIWNWSPPRIFLYYFEII